MGTRHPLAEVVVEGSAPAAGESKLGATIEQDSQLTSQPFTR